MLFLCVWILLSSTVGDVFLWATRYDKLSNVTSNWLLCDFAAGRLLRAYNVEFNWFKLSSWINITEQWPYRLSWIILEVEDNPDIEDTLSLKAVYDRSAILYLPCNNYSNSNWFQGVVIILSLKQLVQQIAHFLHMSYTFFDIFLLK